MVFTVWAPLCLTGEGAATLGEACEVIKDRRVILLFRAIYIFPCINSRLTVTAAACPAIRSYRRHSIDALTKINRVPRSILEDVRGFRFWPAVMISPTETARL
jgi:hypothetical protein